MAPAIRAVAPPGYGPTAETPAIQAPPDAEQGDLLLVFVVNDGSATLATPTGWTLLDGPNSSSTNTSYLFGRIADRSTTDNFSAVKTGSATWLNEMVVVSGVNPLSVTDAIPAHAAGFEASVNSTAHVTPTIQTTEPKQFIIAFFSSDSANAAHSWTPNQLGFSLLYQAYEGIGQQASAGFVGVGPNYPGAFAVNATVSSTEIAVAQIVAIATGTDLPPYAIDLETALGALDLETGIDRLQLEDASGVLLEECDLDTAFDRLLMEDGYGVLLNEWADPKFRAVQMEDGWGNLLLEDGSLLISEGLLAYAIDQETTTTDRLLMEDGLGVLLNEEPDSIQIFYAVDQEAGVDRLQLEDGSGVIISEEPQSIIAGFITYFQVVASSLSFSGVEQTRIGKVLAGGLSFTGPSNLVNRIVKGMTGILSFTGPTNLVKRITTGLSAAVLSFNTAFTANRFSFVSLSAVLSFSGSQTRRVGKGLSGTLSFTGATIKRTAHALTGALGFTGALTASRIVFKALTATLSFTGANARRISTGIAGNLSFTGSVTKRTSTAFVATLSFVGVFARLLPDILIKGHSIVVNAHYQLTLQASQVSLGNLTSIHWYYGAFKRISVGAFRAVSRAINNFLTQNQED